jgi:hypothetical protein
MTTVPDGNGAVDASPPPLLSTPMKQSAVSSTQRPYRRRPPPDRTCTCQAQGR